MAWVSGVGEVTSDTALELDESITRQVVDANAVKCPDPKAADKMTKVCFVPFPFFFRLLLRG